MSKSKQFNKWNPTTYNWSKIYWTSLLVIIVSFSFGATWMYLQTFMENKPDAAAMLSGIVVFFMANVALIAFNKVK